MSPAATPKPSALYGGFISEPSAFQDLPAGLQHVIKLMYRPGVRDNGDVGLDLSTEAFVVDLAAVDPALLDAKKLAADCDLLKTIALAHEREMRQIITELQKGTAAGVAKAEKLVKDIGATEADAVAAGGGWISVILALGAYVLSGCVGSGSKHKATSPGATTTPKPPPSP